MIRILQIKKDKEKDIKEKSLLMRRVAKILQKEGEDEGENKNFK